MDLAVGDQVIDHIGGGGDGDREAETLHARRGGRAHLHRVDANDLTVHIDERTAGVAVVERGVRLDQRHRHAVDIDVAVDGGDDAVGQRAAQIDAERVADGIDRVADRERVGIAELRGGKPVSVHLDDGKVLLLIEADELRLIALAADEHDIALRPADDHMGVGENIAVLREDHAGADHRAAVRQRRHHRHGAGIDPFIDLLNGQLRSVRLLIAQLRAVAVGVGRNARFTLRFREGVVPFVAIGMSAARRAEHAGSIQRGDHRAGEHHHRKTDKEHLPSAPALFRRERRALRLLFPGQRRGLHIVLHNGLRRLFVVQHDFAVRRPLRIENAVFFVHILLRYCWSWLPLSESVKVKVVRPFSLVTAMCSLCWSKMVLTM